MAVNRRQAAVRKRTGWDRFIPVIPSVASFKLHSATQKGNGGNSQTEEQKDHWDAIAEALEFRPLNKILQYSLNSQRHMLSTTGLKGSFQSRKTLKQKKTKKIRNSVPYRSLDAPGLLNDYYCTLVAWSTVSGHLAVGLGSQVFLWTEYDGSHVLPLPDDYGPVSCLAFSCSNVLAVGRKDGSITCYDVNNSCTRSIYVHVDAAVCCAAWLPQSETELFVGDEIGNVMLLKADEGDCSMHRTSVLKCHTQQICGIAFSPDLTQLAIGGNDNMVTIWDITDLSSPLLQYRMMHRAAVKGLAFCPWIPSLLATGGGTHDRTIRFWHTRSGTMLDSYNVKGQITSIIWSRHCKQLAITFGFGNHEKPLLVSVYTFPKFRPLIQVPTDSACRVISAVPSPDGGCICMASTDETVRFFELWPGFTNRTTTPQVGMFGSDIIDMLEGIEKQGEVIR